jgi:hypothetical protein
MCVSPFQRATEFAFGSFGRARRKSIRWCESFEESNEECEMEEEEEEEGDERECGLADKEGNFVEVEECEVEVGRGF